MKKDYENIYLDYYLKNKYYSEYPPGKCNYEWCNKCYSCYKDVCDYVSKWLVNTEKKEWRKGDLLEMSNKYKIKELSNQIDGKAVYDSDIEGLINTINKHINFIRNNKYTGYNILHLSFVEELINELYNIILEYYSYSMYGPHIFYIKELGYFPKTKLKKLNLACLEIWIEIYCHKHNSTIDEDMRNLFRMVWKNTRRRIK
jgi:hypothetical protein